MNESAIETKATMPVESTNVSTEDDIEGTFPVKASCLKLDGGQYESYGFYAHPSDCQMYVRCDQVSY